MCHVRATDTMTFLFLTMVLYIGTILCHSASAKIAKIYRMLSTARYYSECYYIH